LFLQLSCLLVQAAVLLLLSEGEKMCPASCRCEGKIVYFNCQGLSLRYNNLLGLLPLKELILSSNKISHLHNNTFSAIPNLRNLDLSYNQLHSVPVEAVAAWTSLTTISLAGNSWDCRPSICPLMVWLLTIRDAKDISMICSGPKRAQGERVVDAIRNHSTCPDNVFSTTALLLLHTSTAAKNTTSQHPTTVSLELDVPEATAIYTPILIYTVCHWGSMGASLSTCVHLSVPFSQCWLCSSFKLKFV
uniref:LRRNT domain-containing protein n=1 Tax=Periophthalmus magnuspinnatus TaxID=409849 RepID=A0A3B4BN02_9GOBI